MLKNLWQVAKLRWYAPMTATSSVGGTTGGPRPGDHIPRQPLYTDLLSLGTALCFLRLRNRAARGPGNFVRGTRRGNSLPTWPFRMWEDDDSAGDCRI